MSITRLRIPTNSAVIRDALLLSAVTAFSVLLMPGEYRQCVQRQVIIFKARCRIVFGSWPARAQTADASWRKRECKSCTRLGESRSQVDAGTLPGCEIQLVEALSRKIESSYSTYRSDHIASFDPPGLVCWFYIVRLQFAALPKRFSPCKFFNRLLGKQNRREDT